MQEEEVSLELVCFDMESRDTEVARGRRRNEKWGRGMLRWSVVWRRWQHLGLFCCVWVLFF